MPERPVTSAAESRPKLGVFGGTFDPPHIGHLVAAINTAHDLGIDEILLVVANVPWQKVESRGISSAADRMAMVELSVVGRPELSASPMEIQRGGDSITADTLEELQDLYPNHDFVVILGSDAAAGLPTWRRGEVVRELATIAVVDRPGASAGERAPDDYDQVQVGCPLMDLSSTDIRRRTADGLPIDYLVVDGVADFIAARGLYR